MVSQAVPLCPEHTAVLTFASSKGICTVHSCSFFRHALFSLFLLLTLAQIVFISFPPTMSYCFPPPTDITTLASKNQSSCFFSSLDFTILFGHLSLWMLCPPFFTPFIAVSCLLPSLSFSRILPCSLSQIWSLPWIPLPLECHICLWLLLGTSTSLLMLVLKWGKVFPRMQNYSSQEQELHEI